jgi:hypothetical protein
MDADLQAKSSYLRALLQNWTILNRHVEKVDLLIPVSDLTVFVDPDQCIFDFCSSLSWLMNTNVNGQLRLSSLILQSDDEVALFYRTN